MLDYDPHGGTDPSMAVRYFIDTAADAITAELESDPWSQWDPGSMRTTRRATTREWAEDN